MDRKPKFSKTNTRAAAAMNQTGGIRCLSRPFFRILQRKMPHVRTANTSRTHANLPAGIPMRVRYMEGMA